MSAKFSGIAWRRRGWGPTQRSLVSRDGAYPWSVLQAFLFEQVEDGWAIAGIPDGSNINWRVFWFVADVPALLHILATGSGSNEIAGGRSLQRISPALFGASCVNTQDAPVGTQFRMNHAAAGLTLGFPSEFVPAFGVNPNANVSVECVANGGVLQGPPFALPTKAHTGWTPAVINIADYTAAIRANNNLIDAGAQGTLQVVGLYAVTFDPP